MYCGNAGVLRLFDLVKCSDEALRPAFFYALGDTVVAGDLDQASRIAYGREKRWARVVTLQVCLHAFWEPLYTLMGRSNSSVALGLKGWGWQAYLLPRDTNYVTKHLLSEEFHCNI